MDPAADAVNAQLERILASDAFAGAGRASSLLRYVVDRTAAGDGDSLKEYVLGVEVFERGDQFDPRLDTIVRVEARRLRAKLDEYYQGLGASDPIRIDIPRGSYVPTFTVRALAADPAAPPSPAVTAPAPASRRQTVMWAAAVGLVVLAVVAGWRLLPHPWRASADSAGIRIAVLPLAHFSTEPEVAMVAARITDGVTADLARIPELSVVSRTSAARFGSEQQPVREVARALDATLVMEGSLVVEAGGIHVVTRLVDAVLDRKVWVGEYDSPPDQIAALQRRIAGDAAAAVLKLRPRR